MHKTEVYKSYVISTGIVKIYGKYCSLYNSKISNKKGDKMGRKTIQTTYNKIHHMV